MTLSASAQQQAVFLSSVYTESEILSAAFRHIISKIPEQRLIFAKIQQHLLDLSNRPSSHDALEARWQAVEFFFHPHSDFEYFSDMLNINPFLFRRIAARLLKKHPMACCPLHRVSAVRLPYRV